MDGIAVKPTCMTLLPPLSIALLLPRHKITVGQLKSLRLTIVNVSIIFMKSKARWRWRNRRNSTRKLFPVPFVTRQSPAKRGLRRSSHLTECRLPNWIAVSHRPDPNALPLHNLCPRAATVLPSPADASYRLVFSPYRISDTKPYWNNT